MHILEAEIQATKVMTEQKSATLFAGDWLGRSKNVIMTLAHPPSHANACYMQLQHQLP